MNGFEFLDDGDFVTVPELAALLGKTRQQIGDMVRDGRLAAQGRSGRGGAYLVRVGDALKAFPQLRERRARG